VSVKIKPYIQKKIVNFVLLTLHPPLRFIGIIQLFIVRLADVF